MSKQNIRADTDNVHKYGEMCRAEQSACGFIDWSQVGGEAESRPASLMWTCRCPAVTVIPARLSGDESEAEGQRVLSV